MIRLTLLLCAGLFAAMLIAGQDHGQLRFGLMAAQSLAAPPALPQAHAAEPLAAPTEVGFAPARPVMAEPAVAEVVVHQPTVVAVAAPVVTPNADNVQFIASKSVNVREGPGKDFAVISRLARGEAVLVVTAGNGPEGWSLIRIEGDGIEGYVASRLLTD